jgi:DNA-binding CsgD family transcriptional regulator
MITDPRGSTDSFVRSALSVWDMAGTARDAAYADATNLREKLSNSGNDQAYAWALATCGRIAAYREQLDIAETFLTESVGRFFLLGDAYGKAVVSSHLAIPQALRGNNNRCLELALEAFVSGIPFHAHDLALMHNIAALCYHVREEFNAALFHLNSEYSILTHLHDINRLPGVVSNIGVLLIHAGEFELALAAMTEAWRLEQARVKDKNELRLLILSHIVCVNCQLDRIDTATVHAEQLVVYLGSRKESDLTLQILDNLAEVYARSGRIDLARHFWQRARAHVRDRLFPEDQVALACTQAQIEEAAGNPEQAIILGNQILNGSLGKVSTNARRSIAAIVCRSYVRMSDKTNAEYWARYRRQVGRENLLNDILSKQIRANLRIEEPSVNLTAQELNCLKLSANGQTSSDIGLKLGIKPRTVNFHFSKILRKLNAMNRQEAIAKAANANLLNR